MERKRAKLIFNRILILSTSFFVVIALGFGIYFSFDSIFKIRYIEVLGNCRYSTEDIIKKINTKEDQNLILFDEDLFRRKIEKELPYIESIEIKKIFPDSLNFKIKESLPKIAIENGDTNKFILLNFDQKILEKNDVVPENLVIVKGINLKNIETGCKIDCENKGQEETLKEIAISASEDDFINKIDVIDFSNPNKIFIEYNKKIKIILGDNEKIEYKMKVANEAVKKINESGELDLYWLPKNGKTFFRAKV